jgi:hypothetical protein
MLFPFRAPANIQICTNLAMMHDGDCEMNLGPHGEQKMWLQMQVLE